VSTQPLDKLIAPADQKRVVEAIHAAEQRTSGQIKVHIEPRGPGGDVMERARHVFAALKLTATKQRNAVLFYIASEEQRFAIVGDEGIHTVVGDDFWKAAAGTLEQHFRQLKFADGLVAAITTVGETLRAKFPHKDDGQNELSDEISTARIE
jgi:uncharacterized membrane protein